jgi:hypothetical protein
VRWVPDLEEVDFELVGLLRVVVESKEEYE